MEERLGNYTSNKYEKINEIQEKLLHLQEIIKIKIAVVGMLAQ